MRTAVDVKISRPWKFGFEILAKNRKDWRRETNNGRMTSGENRHEFVLIK
jgi:hypothetical protein